LLEGLQCWRVFPSGSNGIKTKNSVERWWSDTDREKQVLGESPVPVPLCTSYSTDHCENRAVDGPTEEAVTGRWELHKAEFSNRMMGDPSNTTILKYTVSVYLYNPSNTTKENT
jgi:hypothetical protein